MTDLVSMYGVVLGGAGAVPGPGTYQSISPGIQGFLAIFGVVIATVALMFSMTRHIRKIDHDERKMHENAHSGAADAPSSQGQGRSKAKNATAADVDVRGSKASPADAGRAETVAVTRSTEHRDGEVPPSE